jgi:hypothetical protein
MALLFTRILLAVAVALLLLPGAQAAGPGGRDDQR